jgi:MYXO-CTERM domain-containing protein
VQRSGHRIGSYLLGHTQTEADGGNTPFGNFWWIGASSTSTSAIPNSGVRMEADVITTPAAAAGGCFSVWTSDTLANQMWGQIGYSACNLPGEPFYDLTSFFQVWDLSIGPDGQLVVDQESSDITPGLHAFAMYVESGTTWVFAVDGNVMGAVDMGSTTADTPGGVSLLSEEGDGVAAPFAPPAVAVPVAMEVYTGGTWGPATTAVVVNTALLSGVAGHLQDPALADDQLVIGGSSPTLAAGVALWDGVVTDGGISTASDAGTLSEPYVSVACPAPNSTVGGKFAIPISASADAGVASVAVSVDGANDLDGGSSATLCNLTAPPYTCEWDTSGQSDGPYFLYVLVTDSQGAYTYEDVLVNVSQGAPAPCTGSGDGGAGSDGGGGGPGDAGHADAGKGGGADGGAADGAGAGGDGGKAPLPDGATHGGPATDAAATDAGGTGGGHPSGGCSCDAAGEGTLATGSPGLLWLLGLAAAWRRRAARARGA